MDVLTKLNIRQLDITMLHIIVAIVLIVFYVQGGRGEEQKGSTGDPRDSNLAFHRNELDPLV